MTQWNLRSNRTTTGKKLNTNKKKKKYERGSDFLPVRIGEQKAKEKRVRGGLVKVKLFATATANVMVGNAAQQVKILSVVENKADSQFVRRNIITKGAVIQTEIGKARVTSRPTEDGMVNAVMIEEKKK
ncbi:30S ribosomal protein S8e [Candidatus Woesearchaeota archaeon]|nr:30S ribosomal protein S8e [Candidatus Woesearchaeota archaeon]